MHIMAFWELFRQDMQSYMYTHLKALFDTYTNFTY